MPLRTSISSEAHLVLQQLVTGSGGYIATAVWPYDPNPHALLSPTTDVWLYFGDDCRIVHRGAFLQLASNGLIAVTKHTSHYGREYQITMKGRTFLQSQGARNVPTMSCN